MPQLVYGNLLAFLLRRTMNFRRWLGWSLVCVLSMSWGASANADVVDLEASDNATGHALFAQQPDVYD